MKNFIDVRKRNSRSNLQNIALTRNKSGKITSAVATFKNGSQYLYKNKSPNVKNGINSSIQSFMKGISKPKSSVGSLAHQHLFKNKSLSQQLLKNPYVSSASQANINKSISRQPVRQSVKSSAPRTNTSLSSINNTKTILNAKFKLKAETLKNRYDTKLNIAKNTFTTQKNILTQQRNTALGVAKQSQTSLNQTTAKLVRMEKKNKALNAENQQLKTKLNDKEKKAKINRVGNITRGIGYGISQTGRSITTGWWSGKRYR